MSNVEILWVIKITVVFLSSFFIESKINNSVSVSNWLVASSNKIKSAFLEKLPPKDAAKLLSMVTGESKRDIYKSLMDL